MHLEFSDSLNGLTMPKLFSKGIKSSLSQKYSKGCVFFSNVES